MFCYTMITSRVTEEDWSSRKGEESSDGQETDAQRQRRMWIRDINHGWTKPTVDKGQHEKAMDAIGDVDQGRTPNGD